MSDPEALQRTSARFALLDSSCRVTSSDPRWPRLAELLWGPFLSETEPWGRGEEEISVKPSPGGGFEFKDPDDAVELLSSSWEVVNRICGEMFHLALRKAESFLGLHAAVVAHEGRGLLLIGDAGVGKTTLVMEVLRRRPGWAYYSDDLAPVRLADGRIAPFPKPLSVKDRNLWQSFSPNVGLPGWLGPPNGSFWLPPRLFPRVGGEPASPSRLYFLARGQETALSLLTPGKAVMRCLPYAGESGRIDLAPLATLCRSAESFLLTSRHPTEAAVLLTESS